MSRSCVPLFRPDRPHDEISRSRQRSRHRPKRLVERRSPSICSRCGPGPRRFSRLAQERLGLGPCAQRGARRSRSGRSTIELASDSAAHSYVPQAVPRARWRRSFRAVVEMWREHEGVAMVAVRGVQISQACIRAAASPGHGASHARVEKEAGACSRGPGRTQRPSRD